jgi:membrane-associated phospholipid phosphatase
VAFLFTNILGFILYYSYTAAPPWYVELYGFEKDFSITSSEAGLANFDALFGIKFFHELYTRNSNVFAAVPSLHAAYPIISFYFAWKKRMKIASILFAAIVIGIWFSAIYTRHHYIIDVILGVLCSIVTLFVYEKIVLKTRINRWIDSYLNRYVATKKTGIYSQTFRTD